MVGFRVSTVVVVSVDIRAPRTIPLRHPGMVPPLPRLNGTFAPRLDAIQEFTVQVKPMRCDAGQVFVIDPWLVHAAMISRYAASHSR